MTKSDKAKQIELKIRKITTQIHQLKNSKTYILNNYATEIEP